VAGGYVGTEEAFNTDLAAFKDLATQSAYNAGVASDAAATATTAAATATKQAAQAAADANTAGQAATAAASSRDTAAARATAAANSATAAAQSASAAAGSETGAETAEASAVLSANTAQGAATDAQNANTAAQTAKTAAEAAQAAAEAVLESIPEDYTELSNTVGATTETVPVDTSQFEAKGLYINGSKLSTITGDRLIAIPAKGVKLFHLTCTVSSTKRVAFANSVANNAAVYDKAEYTGQLDADAVNASDSNYLVIQLFINSDTQQDAAVYIEALTVTTQTAVDSTTREAAAVLRTDVDDLETDLRNNTGAAAVGEFLDGYYYKTGSGDTITPGSPTSGSSFTCAYASCAGGDVFTINIYNAGTSSTLPWCFIDQNGSQLKKAKGNDGYYRNVEIEAPVNAAYVVINAGKNYEHRLYRGRLIGNRVSQLEDETNELGGIVERIVTPYLLVDGYDAGNSMTANISRAPWLFPSKTASAVITTIKLKVKTAGTISFGVYDATIEDGDSYDPTKYQLIKQFTVTETGEHELHLDTPLQIPTNKAFAIGQSTDTAEFAYGSHGEKGFYYNSSGTVTYYRTASLGITVSGFETGSGSVLSGKLVSIFGDSISTFSGWIPDGNATFYPSNGVSKVQQTWWKKMIDALSMTLVVNNSWSGRAVSSCRDGETAHATDAGYKEANVLALKDGTTVPEIIIVKLGINDFNHGAYLGDYDGSTVLPDDPATFTAAYAMMLDLIMTNFPLAHVYCCTLMQCEMNNSVTGFPEINTQGESLIEWNEAIRKLAHAFGAKVLDHDVCGLTYYNLSTYMGDYSTTTHKGLHPNAAGHSLIANQTILQLDPTVRQRY